MECTPLVEARVEGTSFKIKFFKSINCTRTGTFIGTRVYTYVVQVLSTLLNHHHLASSQPLNMPEASVPTTTAVGTTTRFFKDDLLIFPPAGADDDEVGRS